MLLQRKEDGCWYLGDEYLAGEDILPYEAYHQSNHYHEMSVEYAERALAFREMSIVLTNES